MKRFSIVLLFVSALSVLSFAQQWMIPSDTLRKSRCNTVYIIGGAAYAGFSTGLYYAWYRQFDRTKFHFFDDLKEWNQMDKAGHIHSAYFQGIYAYKAMRWAGVSKSNSLLTGIITGTAFQSTLEFMDGYSSKWGFSWSDISANVIGTSAFALQQYYWDDQRISIKVSYIPNKYPQDLIFSTDENNFSRPDKRAASLYGTNHFERFLKDYNAQTYWASINIHSFLPQGNKWPSWLNIAVGYGAENMYGGFENVWYENGATFILDPAIYPRYRQFYIGLDVDMPKLNPRNHFLKSFCTAFNIFKLPLPALEINTRGQLVFHLLR